MGFLSAIRNLFGDSTRRDEEQRRKLAQAWNIDESLIDAPESTDSSDNLGALQGATAYDRKMWSKKLRHLITEKLPVPEQEWHDFLADAAALGFDQAWVEAEQRDAFALLLKRIVADGVISGDEQHTIDLARVQLGFTDQQAMRLLDRVVAEAEALLGRKVQTQ